MIDKIRHDWKWNTPVTGQRRCQRCLLVLPIAAHVAVPHCSDCQPKPDSLTALEKVSPHRG